MLSSVIVTISIRFTDNHVYIILIRTYLVVEGLMILYYDSRHMSPPDANFVLAPLSATAVSVCATYYMQHDKIPNDKLHLHHCFGIYILHSSFLYKLNNFHLFHICNLVDFNKSKISLCAYRYTYIFTIYHT